MKQITAGIFSVALLAMAAGSASATVINFDDAYASLGNIGNPATYYSSSDGVTISGTYFGLVGGVGNGDPGNWQLAGTNGSAFLGCNQGDTCSPTFNFDSPASNVSLDLGLSYGTTTTFTVSGYLNSTLVDSKTMTISDPDTTTGTWGTLALSGAVNKVVVSTSGADAYGVDNVVFNAGAATPEPATWSVLAGGLGLMAAVAYRKRRVA
jgi:hypothetical protein